MTMIRHSSGSLTLERLGARPEKLDEIASGDVTIRHPTDQVVRWEVSGATLFRDAVGGQVLMVHGAAILRRHVRHSAIAEGGLSLGRGTYVLAFANDDPDNGTPRRRSRKAQSKE